MKEISGGARKSQKRGRNQSWNRGTQSHLEVRIDQPNKITDGALLQNLSTLQSLELARCPSQEVLRKNFHFGKKKSFSLIHFE